MVPFWACCHYNWFYLVHIKRWSFSLRREDLLIFFGELRQRANLPTVKVLCDFGRLSCSSFLVFRFHQAIWCLSVVKAIDWRAHKSIYSHSLAHGLLLQNEIARSLLSRLDGRLLLEFLHAYLFFQASHLLLQKLVRVWLDRRCHRSLNFSTV